VVADDDPLHPLDVLVPVHLGNHDPDRRPVLTTEWLPVHLIGEHRVGEAGLRERERVDVRVFGRDERQHACALVRSGAASRSSKRTPAQWTSRTDQPVTQ
jgi:hypothetical protein